MDAGRSVAGGTSADPATRGRRGTHVTVLAGAVLAALLATPVGSLAQDDSAAPVETTPGAVTLVAYSTPREAYEEIIPLFQATEAGAGIEFEQSYSGSGDQSRAVEAGLPADLVALSLWPDVERLVEPGLVPPTGTRTSTGASSTTASSSSWFALATPRASPIGTTSSARTSTSSRPTRFTSGGAQWNILAAYQAQIEAGKTEDEALEYLTQLIANTSVMDRSARESLATFMAGQGDVLIGYENEAIFAQQMGQPLEFVIPASSTMLIENPVAVTTVGDALVPATAFVDFLYSPEAQTGLRQEGLPTRGARGPGRVRLSRDRQPLHHRGPGWLGGGPPALLRRGGRHRGRHLLRTRPRRGMSVSSPTAPAVRGPASMRYDGRGLLGPGITAAYLGLLVLIPISAILWRSVSDGLGEFWEAITSPQALAALQLTFTLSAVVTVINALIGTPSPGCWFGTTSRASPSSTPSSTCPSRCPPSWPA